MSAEDDKDFAGRGITEVIGKRFKPKEGFAFEPEGTVVSAFVDGVGIMMLCVLDDAGNEHEMVPLTLGTIA